MDRPSGPEQPWKSVNQRLLRRLLACSTALRVLLAWAIEIMSHNVQRRVGTLIGGGGTIVFMLRLRQRTPAFQSNAQ